MAIPKAFVSYTILDAKGQKAVTHINFPLEAAESGFIDVLTDFAVTTGSIIDALLKGQVFDIGIGISVPMTSVIRKLTPDADSDVEEGGRFQFITALGSLTGMRLPTFDEAYLLPGTKEVDLSDSEVDAFVDRMTEGRTVTLVNVSPSDERGEDIEAISSARESFQSSR